MSPKTLFWSGIRQRLDFLHLTTDSMSNLTPIQSPRHYPQRYRQYISNGKRDKTSMKSSALCGKQRSRKEINNIIISFNGHVPVTCNVKTANEFNRQFTPHPTV